MDELFHPGMIETLQSPVEFSLWVVLVHMVIWIGIGWLLAGISQNRSEVHLLKQSRAMMRDLRLQLVQLNAAHEMAHERGYEDAFETRLQSERESAESTLDRVEELIEMGVDANMDSDDIDAMLAADPEIPYQSE
jgi:hypothetical protein